MNSVLGKMPAKAELRAAMLARRREMSDETHAAACGYVCGKLLSIPLGERVRIAGYMAIHKELDVIQVLDVLYKQGNKVFLPSVTKPERYLKFLEWTPQSPMRTGAYGVTEPEGGQVGVPEVVLVPLVAFDRHGHRLGYGAGYYDATLAQLRQNNPDVLAIGVAFSFQEVDKLPAEAHDMRLDMVVTEKETIRI